MSGSGEAPTKSQSQAMPRPLVGTVGRQNSISVERRPGGIDCQYSTRNYLFILICTFLFGPLLEAVLIFRPDKISPHTPRIVLGATWFMSVMALVSFVRNAMGRHRFTADFGTGEIKYFAWWGSRPSLTLQRGEVQSVGVEEQVFLYEGAKIPNYCLAATTYEGKRYALSISTDKALIETLKADLAAAGFGA